MKACEGEDMSRLAVMIVARRMNWSNICSQLRISKYMLLVVVLSLFGCEPHTQSLLSQVEVPIPAQSDWTDYGTIFYQGEPGEWDHYLYGGFTNTIVKKDDVFYLYYQGASDYRTTFDEGVMWRAIGVAISSDGINFTKHNGNPVITWLPNDEGEEGAVSAGVTLDQDGQIVLFYGANTATSPTKVNADGRLATSQDGLYFTDDGIVLDHADRGVWGSGDELFPVMAIRDREEWLVYYIPNGTIQSGNLGLAKGNMPLELSKTFRVRSGINSVPVWGTGGYARVGKDVYALALNNVRENTVEIRLMSPTSPHLISQPVETYQFEEVRQATIWLEEDTRTWFMFYRAEGEYGVKLAPLGEPDKTPPTAPGNVALTPLNDQEIELTWDSAVDEETGVVLYKVYRDGEFIADVKGWHYRDKDLAPGVTYRYEISALNYHGVEGPRSSVVEN